jgi:hypothetical protein
MVTSIFFVLQENRPNKLRMRKIDSISTRAGHTYGNTSGPCNFWRGYNYNI